MRRHHRYLFWSFVALLAAGAALVAVLWRGHAPKVFTIDLNDRRQTIEGIGATATGMWHAPVRELYSKPAFAQAVGEDLSIIRLALPPEVRADEDLDAESLDLAKFNLAAFDPPADFLRRICQAHPKTKVMLSVWSPPSWMKDNQATTKGGHLRADRREHFAKLCAAACLGLEQKYGVPVYALSIQNEPAFSQTFDSCLYSPEEMVATAKAVRAAFSKWNVKAKLLAPEDMADSKRVTGYLDAFAADPDALKSIDVINVHSEPRAEGNPSWGDLRAAAEKLTKPLWVTETSGEEPEWIGRKGRGGLDLAASLHRALVDGGCSAFVYWAITDPEPSVFALMGMDKPTPKYAALTHFSKYIRPGWARIQVKPSNANILVSAYGSDPEGALTIVLINLNATDTAVSVSLKGSSVMAFHGVRTSTTEVGVDVAATVDSNGLIVMSLPAKSATTLVSNQPR